MAVIAVETRLNKRQTERLIALGERLAVAIETLERTVGDLADRVVMVQPKARPTKKEPADAGLPA